MLASSIDQTPSWSQAIQAGLEGMKQRLVKMTVKAQEILKTNRDDTEYLLQIASKNLRDYCVRDIYFCYADQPTLLSSLTEDQIRLQLKEEADSNIRKVLEEVIRCTNGMFAADILSLDVPLMPKSLKLGLISELDPPLFVKKPTLSDDVQKYANELYEILRNRDKENALYQLERCLSLTDSELKHRKIHSYNPPVPNSVEAVVEKRIREIFNEVFNDDKPQKT